ncbi:MAG: hypothetical protein FJ395_20800 [Verrucomicrobia bacterium]|nr:hypothetical protein [Verrucomicrobiota bacterium]
MNKCMTAARMMMVVSLACLTMALFGCGGGAGGSKAVEDYLVKLEKAVAQWEGKIQSQSFTTYDFGDLNKASVDLIGEGKLLQDAEKWSGGQLAKYDSLAARLSKMLMDLSANPKNLK